jgi:hypothetical protein
VSRSVSSVKVTMNNAASSNVLVGQKVRLLGVQYYIKDNVGGADTGIEDRDIRLQDSAGNDLFRFAILSRGAFGYGVGLQPFNLMLRNSSIVFPDGIHFVNIATSGTQRPAPDEIQLVVFYEGG